MQNLKYCRFQVVIRSTSGSPSLITLYMKPLKLDKFQNSRISRFILSQYGSHITFYLFYLTTLMGSGIAPCKKYINIYAEKSEYSN